MNLDSCIQAFYSLKPEYQKNCAFLLSPSAAQVLRTQKASGSGEYMWRDGAVNGMGVASICGCPVYVDYNLPAASGH